MKKTTRREFLKGALAGTAGLALTGLLGGCAGSNDPQPPPTPTPQPEPEKAPAPAAGIVRGKVTDSNSNMLIAGIIVTDEKGSFVRETTNAFGGYELKLLPGKYTLLFTKGMEFDTVVKEVEVTSLKTFYLPDVRLTQLFDSYRKGWIAGDCHQHSYYSDGVDSIHGLFNGNASMGLYWGFLSDHNTSRGVPEWVSRLSVNVMTDEAGQMRPFVGFDGVEVTSEFGHYNCLGSGLTLETYDLNLRESERSSPDKLTFIREKLVYLVDSIKRVGGVAQMNHPYSSTTMGAANWISLDDYDFLDTIETVEIWNGYFVPPDGIYTNSNAMNQNYDSKLLWYGLLNAMKEGHPFHAATGGSDNHDSRSQQTQTADPAKIGDVSAYYDYIRFCGKYPGMPTTYVRLSPEELTMENVKKALVAGHSFVSNGPVVLCDIDGAGYGETLVPAGGELTIHTDIFNRDGIREIRVIHNGEVIQTVNPPEGTDHYTDPISISGVWAPGDWILLEVLGPISQYAITNPVLIG